jgi:hypothetical protein
MLIATIALLGPLSMLAAGVILLLPFACMSLRWRSFRLGLYSVASGNAVALCFWPGLLRPRIAPASWIESTVVQGADRMRLTWPSFTANGNDKTPKTRAPPEETSPNPLTS